MTAHQIDLITEKVRRLGPAQQQEVYDFIAFLETKTRTTGVLGRELRPIRGSLSDEEARQM
ncbi:DUF2281 domain-containing protein, partial [bacterium]